jgi:hypothetical protein
MQARPRGAERRGQRSFRMRLDDVLERLAAGGAAAQTMVPGVYAWGVTVAPAAWARGSSVLAQGGALGAILALGCGVVGERRWGARARIASLWGFVIASASVWSIAPSGLAPARFDDARGLAGMLGWALFAFASAAPPLRAQSSEDPLALAAPVAQLPLAAPPRRATREVRRDAAYVAAGACAAAVLQTVGWRVAGAERALLIRFVGLAAALAIIGAATEIALARRAPRAVASSSRRIARAMPALVALALLGVAGLLLLASD